MTPELKAKWVAALRSGDYVQGAGYLCDINKRYCCLGVLCEVMGIEKILEKGDVDRYSYVGSEHHLTTTFDFKFLGEVGMTRYFQNDLIAMNDHQHATFNEIATYIEEND